MNSEILHYVCCPYDFSNNWEISFQEIACKVCGRRYPVNNGILSMMPDRSDSPETKIDKLKTIERKVRDEQVEHYLDWFGPYTNSLEYEAISRNLRIEQNDVIADLGCGIGRFTIPLSYLCKEIIAIDFSFPSLLLAKTETEKLGIKNIHFIQADITLLPLDCEKFVKVLSSGVFTTLPGDLSRNTAGQQVKRILQPNGRFVLTVFNNHLYRKIKLIMRTKGVFRKEGTHPVHNFYYYNFSRWDLELFLKEHGFIIDKIIGFCNFPREYVKDFEKKGWKKAIYLVDELLGRTPLSYLLGDFLIASVRKSD